MMGERGRRHSCAQSFGEKEGVIIGNIGREYRELFAAEPVSRAGNADRAAHDLRHMAHDLIAGIMAELVVESLEVTDVDCHAGDTPIGMIPAKSVERLVQGTPIEQPGQSIVNCKIGQPVP